jgi:putative membrane protein
MRIAADIIVAMIALLHVFILVVENVAIAGLYGAATVSKKILFVQTVPAVVGLVVLLV